MGADGRNLAREIAQRAALIAAILGLAAGALAGCGDDEDGTDTTSPTTTTSTGSQDGEKPDRGTLRERLRENPEAFPLAEVVRPVRRYVSALSDGDGAEVCRLLEPGATDGVDFPKPGGDCAAALTASIGYRDPRGLPVFEKATIDGPPEVDVHDADARVTATIVTTFADRPEPSIEDDIIYLHHTGSRWLIVKPSAVFYRAIGEADIPPEVIAEP